MDVPTVLGLLLVGAVILKLAGWSTAAIAVLPVRLTLRLVLVGLTGVKLILLALGAKPTPALTIGEGMEYSLSVVGESFRQDALSRIVGGRTFDGVEHECDALLLPEPSNPRDRNAVRVEIEGEHVGYLSRADAAAMQPVLKRYERERRALTVPATIVGGWDRGAGDTGHFGVRLERVPAE